MASSVYRRLQRKKRKEMKIEDIFWISTWFLNFHTATLSRGMSSWTIWVQSFLPEKALKCTCHFQWLILPKSMFLYSWFRQCRLASYRYSVRLLNLISHVFAGSGHVKEVPFLGWVTLPTSCLGLLGISALLELILFYLLHYYFSHHYMCTFSVALCHTQRNVPSCWAVVIKQVS